MSRRVKPHQVRGRELEEVREKDPDGRIVVHHRTVDTLATMLKSGTITQEMHDAARDLEANFIVAQLDPLRALPILQVPGTGREPELNEPQAYAWSPTLCRAVPPPKRERRSAPKEAVSRTTADPKLDSLATASHV